MNGILVINKEAGMTSHDVVGKLRRLLKTKKIGHAGTLDPQATGVLVLGVGRGTKVLQFLTADRKVYRATLLLGKATTTYDMEGEVVETKAYQNDITTDIVFQVFEKFKGKSKQYPPIYSAIKKNGKPLYAYARENQTIDIEPRDIEIFRLDLISLKDNAITFECEVSKGTYIRSLCVDLAKALGYPGHMSSLNRLQSGIFSLEDAYTLADIEADHYQMIDLDDCLKGMPSYIVEDEQIIYHGKKIKSDCDHQVAIYNNQGHLLAVYGPDGNGYLKSIRGLW